MLRSYPLSSTPTTHPNLFATLLSITQTSRLTVGMVCELML
jgi:hypothetical protein